MTLLEKTLLPVLLAGLALVVQFIWNNIDFLSIFSLPLVDFPSFWGAADTTFNRGLTPYGLSPYHHQLAISLQQEVRVYLYPPLALLFFYPLSLLPYEKAAAFLTFLNLFLYLFLPPVVIKFLFRQPVISWLGICLYLLFYALSATLANVLGGQVNLIVLALICLSFYFSLHRKNEPLGALFLTIATCIKVYPGFLWFGYLACKKYRTCLWCFCWGALFIALGFLFIPFHVWQDWWLYVVPSGSYGKIPHGYMENTLFDPNNLNLNSLVRLLVSSMTVERIFSYILALGMLGYTTYLSRIYVKKHPDFLQKNSLAETCQVFSPFFFTAIAIAPLAWFGVYSIVYPALVCLVIQCHRHICNRDPQAMLFLFILLVPLSFLYFFNEILDYHSYKPDYLVYKADGQRLVQSTLDYIRPITLHDLLIAAFPSLSNLLFWWLSLQMLKKGPTQRRKTK